MGDLLLPSRCYAAIEDANEKSKAEVQERRKKDAIANMYNGRVKSCCLYSMPHVGGCCE